MVVDAATDDGVVHTDEEVLEPDQQKAVEREEEDDEEGLRTLGPICPRGWVPFVRASSVLVAGIDFPDDHREDDVAGGDPDHGERGKEDISLREREKRGREEERKTRVPW